MMFLRTRRIVTLIRKPSQYGPKVFVLGMNKTGTSSVEEALRILGYDHFSTFFNRWPALHYFYHRKLKFKPIFLWLATKFDSFGDSPWNSPELLREFDRKFPNSKFILLHRSKDEYISSYLRYFALRPNVRTHRDPDVIWAEYSNHRESILKYFENRPGDLLDISVKDPLGFKKLATFLGREADANSFPHTNKTPS